MGPDGPTVRTFIKNFISQKLDNFLHRNPDTARALQKRIMQSERERKEIAIRHWKRYTWTHIKKGQTT